MSNTGFPFNFGAGKPVQQPPPNGAYPYSMYAYGQDVPPAYQQPFGGQPFGDQIPVPHAGPYSGYGNVQYMQQQYRQQQMMSQYAATQAANHVYQNSASRANPQEIADSIYSMTQAYQQQQHSPYANARQPAPQTAQGHIHSNEYSASPGQTSNNSIPPLSVRTGPSPALSLHSPAGSNHSLGAERPLLSPHGQPPNHPYNSYHPTTVSQSNQFYPNTNNNQQQPIQPINKHCTVQQTHNVQSNSPISPLSCQKQTSPHFQQPLSQMSPSHVMHSVNGPREPSHQSSCALAGSNQQMQPNTNNLTVTGSSPQSCMVTSPKRQRTHETSPLARTPSIVDVNPSEQKQDLPNTETVQPPDPIPEQPTDILSPSENHENISHNETAELTENNISSGENAQNEDTPPEPEKPAHPDNQPEDSNPDYPKPPSVRKQCSFSSADESLCSESAAHDAADQSVPLSDSLNSSMFSLSKSNGSLKSDNLEDSQSHLPLRKRFKHQSNESLDHEPDSDTEEQSVSTKERSSTSSQLPAAPITSPQPTHSDKINGAITTALAKPVKKRGRPSKDRIRQREAEKLALALAQQAASNHEHNNVFESPTTEQPPKKRAKPGRPPSNGTNQSAPRERSQSINSTDDPLGKPKKSKASVSEMQKALMKVVGSETIEQVEVVKRKRGRPPGSKNKNASKKRVPKNSLLHADSNALQTVAPTVPNLPYATYDSNKPLTVDTRIQPALPVSIPLPHQNNKKRRKSSTLSPARRPGSSTAEVVLPTVGSPWQCVFCQTISNHAQLGDLFGGYTVYPETPVPLKSISGKPPPKHRLGAAVMDSSNSNEVWFHERCIVWSPGVHMMNGNIYGVYEAITLALNTTCSRCHHNGAMVGCYYKGCSKRYHITCAENDGCSIKEENFSIYCPGHKDKKIKLM